jgi:hypothetical protein
MHGTRALITAPIADVLSLDACKVALDISGTDQDGILTAALKASVGQLDPASGGWLGRALRSQTWELRLPGFYGHHRHDHRHFGHPQAIPLPYPPLISVVSIKYDDAGGTEHTLVESTDFRVLGVGTLGKQAVAPFTMAAGRSRDAIRSRCGSDLRLGMRQP